MSGFDLSDYVDVAERLAEFRDKHPTGRIVTTPLKLPEAYAGTFVAVYAEVWRERESGPPDGTGMAWEPVPGKTPYTKESELMNAETSAVGRALVNALVADTKKGVASKQEVRSKPSGRSDRKEKAAAPPDAPSGEGGVAAAGGQEDASSTPSGSSSERPSPSEPATEKQWERAEAVFGSKAAVLRMAHDVFEVAKAEDITSQQMFNLIAARVG